MKPSLEETRSTVAPAVQRRPVLTAIAVLLASLFLLVEALQAWSAWRSASGPLEGVTVGELCSVQLVNGQVYYGRFVDATARQLRLRDVYYVQSMVEAQGTVPNNRLVNRRKVDWHAPETMTIPNEKVMMLERVGEGSRLAQLIEVDQKTSAVPGH